ncbi:MAG: ATP-binding protein [Sphingomonas sp.]
MGWWTLCILGCLVWAINPGPANAEIAPSGTAQRAPAFAQLVDQAKTKMLSDPKAAADLAARARAQLVSAGIKPNAQDLAVAEWLEGEANLRQGKAEEAEDFLSTAWNAVKDAPPSTVMGNILVSRGWLEMEGANFPESLTTFQSAFRIFQKLGDARNQAMTLMSIASLYTEANETDSALKYYSQATEIYSGDAKVTVSLYNNIGNIFSKKRDYGRAIYNYKKALDSANKIQSAPLKAQILRNIARLYLDASDIGAAENTIDSGLKLAASQNDPSSRAQFTEIAARAAFERGNLSRAAFLIGQAINDVDESGDALSLREAHDVAYKIYKKLGRDNLALANFEIVKRLDDQTASLAASANTALMAARFDYTNQNLKIAQLQAQDLQRKIAFERAHARTVRMAFISAGGVTIVIIAMLAIGIVIIRRSRNDERAAKLGLAEANSALAKALAAKTEFLATTSHEIRTPLNGILGMTQVMLADPKLAADTRERLGVVQSAGVTMRALVDDILDVAKMETGNMTIEHAPMDVCQVLTDVARVWRDQAEDRGIAFVLSVDDCPARVMGDAARLRQVVFNLLSNALKFTERGRIELGGTVIETERGRRVRITVSDTGIGIAPDKIDEVFESFRQADASTTRRFGGTGLGLAICRSLTRAMDGEVSVESQIGEGTTFTVELPLIHAAEEAVECDQPGGASLLIVDRNPITRAMLRALLEERAGAVHLAGSIDDARSLLATQQIADVLVDDSAIRGLGDDWQAALAGLVEAAHLGTHFTALWRLDDPAEEETIAAVGIDQLIAKPVAGPVLRDTLYPINATKRYSEDDTVLVTDAA